MTTISIPSYIVSLFADEISEVHNKLLQQISTDYNIDLKELQTKYLPNVDIINSDKEKIKISRTKPKKIEKTLQCIAMTKQNTKCACKKINEHFCYFHQKNQPNGLYKQNTKQTREYTFL